MSIKVELDGLAAEVTSRGPGYLLTTSSDGRPHTIQVWFQIEGTELRAPSGRTTGRNITAAPKVALLWPSTEAGGYSLIVDGDAIVDGAGDSAVVIITATSAILHRPATEKTGNTDEGGSACAPVS